MDKLGFGYGRPLKHISSVRQAHICRKSNLTCRYTCHLPVFCYPCYALLSILESSICWYESPYRVSGERVMEDRRRVDRSCVSSEVAVEHSELAGRRVRSSLRTQRLNLDHPVDKEI